MDYEKKIKNALNDKSVPFEVQAWLEEQIPELKESEDENIRKELMEQVVYIVPDKNETDNEGNVLPSYQKRIDKYIAWLEKQGEKKSVNLNELTWEDINDLDVIMNEVRSDFRNGIGQKSFGLEVLERFLYNKDYEHCEQKPTDKVEPKFKVGDIVKHKDNPHLTYILKRFTDDGDYEFHAIGKDGHEGCTCFSVVKCQDEWELVEQKPVEEYNITGIGSKNAQGKLGKMIKNLKPVNEVLEQNPAWSEEDEEIVNKIIDYMEPMPIFFESTKGKSGKEYTKEFVKEAIKWLKSIKDRYTWKPSERKIQSVRDCALNKNIDAGTRLVLDALYQDLKKLKDEK